MPRTNSAGSRLAKTKVSEEWVSLKGEILQKDIKALASRGTITKLSLTDAPLLTVKEAQAFAFLPPVHWLWLWREVARSAMKDVISIPELRTLDMMNLAGRGKLASFANAERLEVFRCNHCLTAADLLAVAEGPSLREIGAQGAEISATVLDRLLAVPKLDSLDLEATEFTDEMARQVSQSTRLLSLDLGATRITKKGLAHICRMGQLRSLDLWETQLDQKDVELLKALPNLEYVSVGTFSGKEKFDAKVLLRQLAEMPSLRRIWLDGVRVDEWQREELEKRYAYVRIT